MSRRIGSHPSASVAGLAGAAAVAVAVAIAVGGCGGGSAAGQPTLSAVPLAPGATVVASVRRCDAGRHAYCGLELVVAGRRYASSDALRDAEAARLKAAGWAGADGATDPELAAESPRHRLRLTYATAADDLQSIDLGAIHRAPTIALGLSDRMYERAPALSVLVQTGSA